MLPIIYIAIRAPLAKALPKPPIAARFFSLLVLFAATLHKATLGSKSIGDGGPWPSRWSNPRDKQSLMKGSAESDGLV